MIAPLLVAAAVSACAKIPGTSSGGTSGGTTLNGTWTQGCTSSAGIVAGMSPPSSSSFTSKLTISGNSMSYFVQGYTDSACQTVGNSLTTNMALLPVGPDSIVTAAADINLTVNSTSVCTPTCSSNGGVGSTYQGLYIIQGSTLSINWATSRPSTLDFTFTRQ